MVEFIKSIFHNFDERICFFKSLSDKSVVLDIGCGSGNNGFLLRKYFQQIEIHGVDIYHSDDLPGYYKFCSVDLNIEKLPFPDDYFDAVIFTHVIEHLINIDIIGLEINRVMKKYSKIYLETPNWTSILVPSFGINRKQHGPFNFYDDFTHSRPWTKHSLFEFLSQCCSLDKIKVGTVRNWLKFPIDSVLFIFTIFTRNRRISIASFWNLYGWCIYGIGYKI